MPTIKHSNLLIIALFGLHISAMKAQTPNFRLPLVNLHSINPALIGLGHIDNYQAARVQSSVKAQWIDINKRITSSSLSFDIANKSNSSWGINFMNTDFLSARENNRNRYNHTSAQIAYAYLIPGKKVSLKFGMSLQTSNYRFGNANFIWGDQINNEVTAFTNPTQEPIENLSVNSVQAGAGALMIGKKWFAGFGIMNINEPNIAFFSNSAQPLYRKIMVHGGIRILKEFSNTSFTPTVSYSQQFKTKFYAFDAVFQNGNFFYGVGSQASEINNKYAHSLHTFFTIRKNTWAIGYDIDINLSINQSSLPLTHEFTLVYLIRNNSDRKAIFTNLPIL